MGSGILLEEIGVIVGVDLCNSGKFNLIDVVCML